MKVLILGGGSIRAAYQAGVVKGLVEKGYIPDVIIGVSGGAMNGLLIAHLAGKLRLEGEPIDPELIASQIESFWLENVRTQDSIVKKRKLIPLAWSILTKTFKGFLDNSPLKKLIENNISEESVYASPITVCVGSVDINAGRSVYLENTSIFFLDQVIASSSIPLVFDTYQIGSYMMTDGGVVNDIVKKALEYNPTEITAILTTPEQIEGMIDSGDPLDLAERTLDLLLTNSINKELSRVQEVNDLVRLNDGLKDKNGYFCKKNIPLKVIRPEKKLELKITKFNNDDIKNLIDQGYSDGLK